MSEETLNRKERIGKLRGGRWIRYTRAEDILNKLEDLYIAPRTHRMPSILLVGATNNGKTMIARRFHERHRPHVHVDYHNSAVPVLMLQAPPVPDEGRFYNAILSELYVSLHSSRSEFLGRHLSRREFPEPQRACAHHGCQVAPPAQPAASPQPPAQGCDAKNGPRTCREGLLWPASQSRARWGSGNSKTPLPRDGE